MPLRTSRPRPSQAEPLAPVVGCSVASAASVGTYDEIVRNNTVCPPLRGALLREQHWVTFGGAQKQGDQRAGRTPPDPQRVWASIGHLATPGNLDRLDNEAGSRI
jgi:hypothetical protein